MKKPKKPALKTIWSPEWDGDAPHTLKELSSIVEAMRKKYGDDAIVTLDAGYNNVSVMIQCQDDLN